MICLLIQGSAPPLIPLSAISRQSSSHSLPVLPPNDCRRLRFSVTADFVRLRNYYIIIIIIIIIISVDISSELEGLRTSNLVHRWSTKTRISNKRHGQKSSSQGHVMCLPISRERNVLGRLNLVGRLSTPRPRFKVKIQRHQAD